METIDPLNLLVHYRYVIYRPAADVSGSPQFEIAYMGKHSRTDTETPSMLNLNACVAWAVSMKLEFSIDFPKLGPFKKS